MITYKLVIRKKLKNQNFNKKVVFIVAYWYYTYQCSVDTVKMLVTFFKKICYDIYFEKTLKGATGCASHLTLSLIYVDLYTFLLFVCLFVCPSNVPNCLNFKWWFKSLEIRPPSNVQMRASRSKVGLCLV